MRFQDHFPCRLSSSSDISSLRSMEEGINSTGSGSESCHDASCDNHSLHKQPSVEVEAPTLAHEESTKGMRSPEDPDLVTWSGPGDRFNPLNWSRRKKWIATLLVSSFTFISPVGSTMVAPALPTIAEEYNISTSIEEVLVMSIFLLAYAIGPFLWGPLSEVFGRVVVLQSANMVYLIFNTACGFARTKEQMLALRFLSGLGGSAPQAIGGGVLADCWHAEERGSAIAIYSLMPFLGPAVGPIAGGYITLHTSWRWIFHSTSLFNLVIQLLAFLFLSETYAPAILAKRAKRMRKESGNPALHTKWQGPDKTLKKVLVKALVRPFVMLGTQPALQVMSIWRGFLYGVMYLVLSTFPMVFEEAYDQDVGRASMNYVFLGVGFVIGLQISGPCQDRIYALLKRHAINPSASLSSLLFHRKTTSPFSPTTHSPSDPAAGLPEHRLPLALPSSLLIPSGLLLYGLSAHYRTHWILPNIGACTLCIGLIISFNCAQAYVVDTYSDVQTVESSKSSSTEKGKPGGGTNFAASATGAAAFVRTIAGFGFPLFAPTMYDALGVGGGNALLAGVSLVLGIVVPVLCWRWGATLRRMGGDRFVGVGG